MTKRFFCALAFGLLCVPASASAALRYAEPAGDGANPCAQADPCALPTAVSGAVNGDEVVVLAGDYSVASPIQITSAIDVHGADTGPRPTVTQSNPVLQVFTLNNQNATLRNLRLNAVNNSAIYLDAGTMDRMFVHSSGDNPPACSPATTGPKQILNSVCWSSGANGDGIGYNAGSGTFTLLLRNVTAVGATAGIFVNNGGSGAVTITGTNVIASGLTDVTANGTTTMTFEHSNYDTESEPGGATITDAGSGTNQALQPIFVNAGAGDFHQTSASPTVDAGLDADENGDRDIDGDSRILGFRTDIGADEYDDIEPTAVADSATVAQNAPATTLDVLANDTDPDGGPLFIDSATTPAHGTANPTLADISYQPTAGYCGADSFTYTLNGGSTATVSITVTCFPTAVADSATVAQNAAATPINVLANDTDPDAGPKMIDSASDPLHGAVATTPASLTYKPDAGYCGPDSFTYAVNGGSTAIVSITVTCPPDTTAPNTRFVKKPPKRTRNRVAKFRFASTEEGSTFQCKVDKRRFRSCGRVLQLRVKPGKHVIRVRATDAAGNRDATPAVYRWRVLRRRR